jgi:tetratricopeptide (TPR) repeat protein
VLQQIDTDDVPTSLENVEAASGTRIGAGVQFGLESLDANEPRRGMLLLLTDGDDPLDDDEWRAGVAQARTLGVPIHTVGVGDPGADSTIQDAGQPVLFDGKPIETRLRENVPRTLAERTGGTYVPAHRQAFPLGRLMRKLMTERVEEGEMAGTARRAVLAASRRAGCVGLALACFVLAFALPEGISRRRAMPRPTLLVALLAFALISADPREGAPAHHAGDAAMMQGDYARALTQYARAAATTRDPGLVAYNQGIAYYRLGQHAEAEGAFRRAMEDDAAPPSRRARALLGLGNAMFKQAGDGNVTLLARAMAAYRACLEEAPTEPGLAQDARYNLELARMLWAKAHAKAPPTPGSKETPPPSTSPKGSDENPLNLANGEGDGPGVGKGESKDGAKGGAQRILDQIYNAKNLTTLPDDAVVNPMSPHDTAALLDQLRAKLARDRRASRAAGPQLPPEIKNW